MTKLVLSLHKIVIELRILLAVVKHNLRLVEVYVTGNASEGPHEKCAQGNGQDENLIPPISPFKGPNQNPKNHHRATNSEKVCRK